MNPYSHRSILSTISLNIAKPFCYVTNETNGNSNDKRYLLERQHNVDAREDDHWQQTVAQHRHHSPQGDSRHRHQTQQSVDGQTAHHSDPIDVAEVNLSRLQNTGKSDWH